MIGFAIKILPSNHFHKPVTYTDVVVFAIHRTFFRVAHMPLIRVAPNEHMDEIVNRNWYRGNGGIGNRGNVSVSVYPFFSIYKYIYLGLELMTL